MLKTRVENGGVVGFRETAARDDSHESCILLLRYNDSRDFLEVRKSIFQNFFYLIFCLLKAS